MKNKSYSSDNDPLSRFGKKAGAFKYPFFFTFAALLVALNFNLITLWPLLLFLLSSAMWMLYLAITQITCPQCNARLLNRKSLADPNQCYRCGFRFSFPEEPETDELAQRAEQKYPGRTDWHPLPAATSNFDPYRLKIEHNGQLSFRPTGANLFFSLLFAFFGLSILIFVFGFLFILGSAILHLTLPLAPLIGFVSLLIAILGLFLLYNNFRPIRFDPAKGFMRLGRGEDNLVELARIKAVQLLAQKVRSSNRSHNPHISPGMAAKQTLTYQNYQINLVLKDGKRRHVVSYFNRDGAVEAAQQLADHMGLPLWNGLEMRGDPEI